MSPRQAGTVGQGRQRRRAADGPSGHTLDGTDRAWLPARSAQASAPLGAILREKQATDGVLLLRVPGSLMPDKNWTQ
jgi:hypothetical protein